MKLIRNLLLTSIIAISTLPCNYMIARNDQSNNEVQQFIKIVIFPFYYANQNINDDTWLTTEASPQEILVNLTDDQKQSLLELETNHLDSAVKNKTELEERKKELEKNIIFWQKCAGLGFDIFTTTQVKKREPTAQQLLAIMSKYITQENIGQYQQIQEHIDNNNTQSSVVSGTVSSTNQENSNNENIFSDNHSMSSANTTKKKLIIYDTKKNKARANIINTIANTKVPQRYRAHSNIRLPGILNYSSNKNVKKKPQPVKKEPAPNLLTDLKPLREWSQNRLNSPDNYSQSSYTDDVHSNPNSSSVFMPINPYGLVASSDIDNEHFNRYHSPIIHPQDNDTRLEDDEYRYPIIDQEDNTTVITDNQILSISSISSETTCLAETIVINHSKFTTRCKKEFEATAAIKDLKIIERKWQLAAASTTLAVPAVILCVASLLCNPAP